MAADPALGRAPSGGDDPILLLALGIPCSAQLAAIMQYYIQMIPASDSAELEEDLNHFLRSHRLVQVQKSLQVLRCIPRSRARCIGLGGEALE